MIPFMKYVLMLMMLLALAVPGSAGEREDALLNGLLGLGSRVLEVAKPAAGDTAAPAAQHALSASAAPTAAPFNFVQTFVDSVKQAADGVIEEYKEAYKQEGRDYAREVGDIVVERVVSDPEINSTITSLRTLCWFVVGYLTLVTFIMLGCLVYLKRANARLLAQVEILCREVKRDRATHPVRSAQIS